MWGDIICCKKTELNAKKLFLPYVPQEMKRTVLNRAHLNDDKQNVNIQKDEKISQSNFDYYTVQL